MRRSGRGPLGSLKWRDEQGSVLAIVTVCLVALLAIMALAVDLSMLLNSRSEAQRVSDAAALAGASAYIDFEVDERETSDSAIARAKAFAASNNVGKKQVDVTTGGTVQFTHPVDGDGYTAVGPEIIVQALPNASSPKVRVWIARSALPAWFSRLLGAGGLGVRAMAAAIAAEGSRVSDERCVMPIAMPDFWHDVDDDREGVRLPDVGEEWEWDEGDIYDTYDPQGYNPNPHPDVEHDYHGTGYGSPFRDPTVGDDYTNDFGRRIWVKDGPSGQGGEGSGSDSPGDLDISWAPGNFGWWAMPDPAKNCEPSTGADWLRSNILNCNSCPISVSSEEPYEATNEPGNVASVKDEMEQIYAQDPHAEWQDGCTCSSLAECGSCIVGSEYANPLESPRVRAVAVFSPDQMSSIQGRNNIYFNNFATMFFEGGGSKDIFWPDFQIYGRFLGPVSGSGDGGDTGSLLRYLRLVE